MSANPAVAAADSVPAIAANDEVASVTTTQKTVFGVLGAVSFSHFLNDLIQSLLPSIYPMLKTSYALDFGQIGLLTLHLPDHRIAAAAGRRRVHGSQATAVFAAARHELHADGAAAALARGDISAAACSRRR